jgi:nucleotidyltransferase/DNA polymerase involved in DNA repair
MERTILHFDGDSFFASVEQVINFRLKGKPLVTGGERGAITSVSVEGKKLGVNRGMTLKYAKGICPELIVVPSNYLSYSIFAQRMYSIVREFTPDVEEYSIDECFAEITGLDKKYKVSYEEIALMIKTKLEASLGITFGVGMGPNKVIAKMASKHRKPAGFTPIKIAEIPTYLKDLSVGKLWGIGSATTFFLNSLGVKTALDFSSKNQTWLLEHKIAKPYIEIWQELRGYFIKQLLTEPSNIMGSIIKSRTFRPPSSDRSYLLAQLSHNIESACIKARKFKVKARNIRFYLKTTDFSYRSCELSLNTPLSTPSEIVKLVESNFYKIYQSNIFFRASGISLSGIVKEEAVSNDLFGESLIVDKSISVFKVVDDMAKKYGQHTVFLGSSFGSVDRLNDKPKKSLDIPFLGKVR